ncbi:TadE family type IV pilus minor pilin, partial [Streptomyces albidoflavus]
MRRSEGAGPSGLRWAGGACGRRYRCSGDARKRRDGQRGAVTAEAAVVLPTLVVFLLALVWALLAVAAHIQCVDAARGRGRAPGPPGPPPPGGGGP